MEPRSGNMSHGNMSHGNMSHGNMSHGNMSHGNMVHGNMFHGNIFHRIPAAADEELFEELAAGADVRIERIVSYGQASPPGFWYDQETHEWVMVLRGRARLELEGEEGVLEMGPGDYVDIPAHRKHRVAWTSPDEPTVWLAVHY